MTSSLAFEDEQCTQYPSLLQWFTWRGQQLCETISLWKYKLKKTWKYFDAIYLNVHKIYDMIIRKYNSNVNCIKGKKLKEQYNSETL